MCFHRIFSGIGNKKITSFEVVTLHLSGMRYETEYEIVYKDGGAEITEYSIRYAQGEKQRTAERRADCSAEEVLSLLSACKILSWDGFYGRHPRNVKDGTMFTLTAIVNDGRKIYAHGSQNFPRNYWKFTDGLKALLNS